MQRYAPGGPYLIAGALLFGLGCLSVVADSAWWYLLQQGYSLGEHGSVMAQVESYYLTEAIAIGVAVVGVYLLYKGILAGMGEARSNSIKGILAGAISSRRDLTIGVAAALLYGLLYLFVSGVIIFQPGTNEAAWAGISGPSWTAAACCGSVGTVPVLVFYASPQAHLAFQVLPLDALFAVIVPLLVGFNVTVAANSVRIKEVRKNAGWMSSLGVLAGLFTGCPTCAGLFLAGAVGGVGVTTFAVALAPYQMLFVVVSIPLLIGSPLLIAYSSRRALGAACALPHKIAPEAGLETPEQREGAQFPEILKKS